MPRSTPSHRGAVSVNAVYERTSMPLSTIPEHKRVQLGHTDASEAQPGYFWSAIADKIMRRISPGKDIHFTAASLAWARVLILQL